MCAEDEQSRDDDDDDDPYNQHGEEEHDSQVDKNQSPISNILGESGHFRASDPGRFAEDSANMGEIVPIDPLTNQSSSKKTINRQSDTNGEEGKGGHLQDHLGGRDSEGDPLQKEEGEYTFENGAIYKGQWLGRFRHGYGKQAWPDGARYEGEWSNNKAHGRGVFYHVDGDVFDGEWKEDKAHGFGTYYNVNGSKYEGYWVDDLQDGEGKETWKDGSVYEGMYR